MLIGGDDVIVTNDNHYPSLAHVFQCLFTFMLVSALCRLAEIWLLKSTRSHRGIGVGIQIPKHPRELAHRLI